MPIIWRYLLTQYAKVLALATTTFVAILFVSRLKQLAQFAALGAGGTHIGMFALFLIPYILPIAVPISCLISAILLYQRLSSTHELTAMRSCGLGLRQITAPVLMAGALVALLNFYAASELATHCHLLGRRMEAQTSNINPLLALQNPRLMKAGDTFADMRTLSGGSAAEDLTLIACNGGNLGLLSAKTLQMEDDVLQGSDVHVVTYRDDTLIVEHSKNTSVPISAFSGLIENRRFSPKNSHLKLSLLLKKMRSSSERSRGYSEIARRLSLALAAFTFTLMGCSYGIQISRRPSKKGVLFVLALSTLYITSFSIANGLTDRWILSATLSLLPQAFIISLCIFTLKRFTRGIA